MKDFFKNIFKPKIQNTMSKKVNRESINHLTMKDFFEKSDKEISGIELTKQFNEKHGTDIHYNDMQAYLQRSFGIAGKDGEGYHSFKVKFKSEK
jgi:hypothetical protein